MDIEITKKLEGFDWGWMGEDNGTSVYHRESIILEIFVQKAYERFFQVEEGDIVMDFGASVGPFTYSILEKNPAHVYCFEPSPAEIETLHKNISENSVTIVNKGVSDFEGEVEFFSMFGTDGENKKASSTTFEKIIEDFNIEKIDFIKTDCEGGEYSIFNSKNIFWIKENVKKIVGEWHLESKEDKEKFRIFRDTYLRLFPNYQVYSVDGFNIKYWLWTEDFINYYGQVIVYIDNRE